MARRDNTAFLDRKLRIVDPAPPLVVLIGIPTHVRARVHRHTHMLRTGQPISPVLRA